MSYLYFIGIDISKDSFEVACYNQPNTPRTQQFSNNKNGFAQFIKTLEYPITHYFITLEATGGYEQNLLFYLCLQRL